MNEDIEALSKKLNGLIDTLSKYRNRLNYVELSALNEEIHKTFRKLKKLNRLEANNG